MSSIRGVVTPLRIPQREHRGITEVGIDKPQDNTAAAVKENVVEKAPLNLSFSETCESHFRHSEDSSNPPWD